MNIHWEMEWAVKDLQSYSSNMAIRLYISKKIFSKYIEKLMMTFWLANCVHRS